MLISWGVPSKFRPFFLGNEPLIGLSTKMGFGTWWLHNIEIVIPNKETCSPNIYPPLYFHVVNVRQSIRDKVRCYWEHVGNSWELGENTLKITKFKKIQQPPPSPKRIKELSIMLKFGNPSLAKHNVIPNHVHHLFWPRLMVWASNVGT
jgi:hypothetical protein